MKKAYQVINEIVENLLVFIFGLLVVDVLWQVFSRFALGTSSSFTDELARFALIWLTVLGAAYLTGQNSHLAIDLFTRKLKPAQFKKRQQIIQIIIIIFAVFVLIIGGGNLVYITLRLGQSTSVLNIPRGFIYAIVPFSGFMMVFYAIFNIIHPPSKV